MITIDQNYVMVSIEDLPLRNRFKPVEVIQDGSNATLDAAGMSLFLRMLVLRFMALPSVLITLGARA